PLHFAAILTLVLSCSRAHQDLPPFPTRRSSDLRGAEVAKLNGDAKATKDELAVVVAAVKAKDDKIVDLEDENKELGMKLDTEVRSEEHTSELQSQSNLVCRLLLEKKKKK